MSFLSKKDLDRKHIINFSISRYELLDALCFLSPFVAKKRNVEYEEEDEELKVLDESFFRDKVTFLFYETHLCLSVLVDGVRIERTCSVETGYDEVTFCVTFEKLKDSVSQHTSPILSFVEDRFFGFIVYDEGYQNILFNLQAYSVRTQPQIHPKFFHTLYPELIALEHDTFIDALGTFAKYCSADSYRLYETVIWFYVDDHVCTVVSTNGKLIRLKKYSTGIEGCHIITVPGLYAKRIYDVVLSWGNYTHQQVGYNDSYARLYNYDRGNRYSETIEFPLCKENLPDFKIIVDNPTIVHKVRLSLDDLAKVFRIIEVMDSHNLYAVMHFIKDHVNFHYEDRGWNKKVFQFIDTEDCGDDFVLKINYLYFKTLVSDIDTEYVDLYVDDSKRVHLVCENEDLGGDNVLILCSERMGDTDRELLENGDKSLSSNETYIKKYLKVSKPRANSTQMAEAVSRMEHIGVYDVIIEDFKKSGIPQVYEPPYGASYSLDEEDDSVLIEAIDRLSGRGMLVWGVIRCMMTYNRQPVTVDCMLYVSKDKREWPSERENLFSGYPHVFTCCKEIPSLRDQGSIPIYMSESGTPLRRM